MRCLFVTLLALAWMGITSTQVVPLPNTLETRAVAANGIGIHVRAGGHLLPGFAQLAAFERDAIANEAFLLRGKLAMPVLAVGGEQSLGPMMASVTCFAADDVAEARRAGLRVSCIRCEAERVRTASALSGCADQLQVRLHAFETCFGQTASR